MTEHPKVLVISENDNVATALEDIAAGAIAIHEGREIAIARPIQFGHKFALRTIATGSYIVKYGARVGIATSDIEVGEHVHVHNVRDIVDEVRRCGRGRQGKDSA